jgi:RNA polymerase sigma-70 factor (ECF subfamily)
VDELTLLDKSLSGDEAAFTALYRLRQGAVYRFALHMTGDTVIAEDVTQETFLALLTQGSRFDPERGTLASFLYGIARHHVCRRLPKAQMTGDLDDLPAAGDLFENLHRRESIEQVRRAVLSLPESYREAVVLCDLQEASYEEAAAALDCPVGTVRSRLNRGRTLLAEKLKANATSVVRSCS